VTTGWPAGGDGKREAAASTEEDGCGGVRAQRSGSGSDGAGMHGGARLRLLARRCPVGGRGRNGEARRAADGSVDERSGVAWHRSNLA
jgi:hypothetical protein